MRGLVHVTSLVELLHMRLVTERRSAMARDLLTGTRGQEGQPGVILLKRETQEGAAWGSTSLLWGLWLEAGQAIGARWSTTTARKAPLQSA